MSVTVVVTGASGFIGHHVVERLRDEGADIVALEHRWRDREELDCRLGRRDVDRGVHLGWYVAPSDYLHAREANLRALADSLDLVEALAARRCRHLVVAGTSAEYAPSERPIMEDDLVRPRSAYGASKAALATLLNSTWRPPGLRVAWARLFNITGPGEHPDRLLPWVTRSMLAGRTVDLSPGDQVRDFLDVRDVAAALTALSASDADGAFNVCSGRGVTLRELLTGLAALVQGEALLEFGARPIPGGEPMVVVGDNTRLIRATGWQPRIGVEAMLGSVVEWWSGDERPV
jgi:nucleoside-diphosphate-sugar epimerase